MNKERNVSINQESAEFCLNAVLGMFKYYSVTKSDFVQMLKDGFTEIKFGRSPVNFSEEKTAKYVVSLAAFFGSDNSRIETFEIFKESGTFGSYSYGVEKKSYSPKKFQKIVDKFRIVLASENLEEFIPKLRDISV